MARIAIAWELGGGLGHASACNALASTLRLRGHEIAFMFADLGPLKYLQEVAAHAAFEAPSGAAQAPATVPASYAEILVGCGYSSAQSLRQLLHGWLQRLDAWKPDLVIADYAPTALLAARVRGLRRISFGNGFALPPRLSPLPSFRFDEPVEAGRIARFDRQALASVNAVLAELNGAPLQQLAQMLEGDEEFLCTFPELDHYGNRPASGYWGPFFQLTSGARAAWPAGRGKRILAYLRPGLAQLDPLIDQLAKCPHSLIAFVPNLDEGRRTRLAGPLRQVFTEPVKLQPLLERCDLALTHGGTLATGLLLHGIPQVVFPLQYEQYITARRLEQLGCATWVGTAGEGRHAVAAINTVLADPGFGSSARAFARRYPKFSVQEQRRRMGARIEEILARRGAEAHILRATPAREERK